MHSVLGYRTAVVQAVRMAQLRRWSGSGGPDIREAAPLLVIQFPDGRTRIGR